MISYIFNIILLVTIILLSSCAQLQKPDRAERKPTPSPVYIPEITDFIPPVDELENIPHEAEVLSKMYLIGDGTNPLGVRAALLATAEKSIDIQFYIWRSDLTGKILFNGLLSAADRGVKVRILLDDMPVKADAEANIYALDQHKNIQIRLYNPFATEGFRNVTYLVSPRRINHRMHNKSFSVDSRHTIIGGRNIGNEFFSAQEGKHFRDIDVLATGPVVGEAENQFNIYWNSRYAYPVTVFDHNTATVNDLALLKNELGQFALIRGNLKYHFDIQASALYQSLKLGGLPQEEHSPIYTGAIQVIYDELEFSPENSKAGVTEKHKEKSDQESVASQSQLNPYIENITDTFELISPYFVPGERGVEYLTSLVSQGVRVRVITNSLSSSDGLMAQSGYSRQRYELLEGGVELYELKSNQREATLKTTEKANIVLHAKTYIFDRKRVFIGSFNLHRRSEKLNAEVGVIYDVPDMANAIATSVFDEQALDATYRVKLAEEDMEIGGIEINKGEIYWIEIVDGKEVCHATEPETGFWERFGQSVFSIMPVESQL